MRVVYVFNIHMANSQLFNCIFTENEDGYMEIK